MLKKNKSKIVSFGIINKSDSRNMMVESDAFEINTSWFENTTPSIHDTNLFLPEFEDPKDINWVMMYFIAENYKELLLNNNDILCEEAKTALNRFKIMRDSVTVDPEEKAKQMRKLAGL